MPLAPAAPARRKSLSGVWLIAGSDDAAFAGEMFANGAGKDFDSLLRQVEFGSADHHAGDVFGAGWNAALLHDGVAAGQR